MASAIEFDHVSKQYRLGLVSTKTLSHDIRRFWITNILHHEDPYLKIGETNDRSTKGSSEYVWALKDINFKVEQGDVVGIIGKNGAGKSTLLKLLSRVTGPTTGTIRAHGRIGSLLEVGTGSSPLGEQVQDGESHYYFDKDVAEASVDSLDESDVELTAVEDGCENGCHDTECQSVSENAENDIKDGVLRGETAHQEIGAEADEKGGAEVAYRPVEPEAPSADEVSDDVADARSDCCRESAVHSADDHGDDHCCGE